ncbi:hypothetical protein DPMN_151728 [Dreissena polymorpha]|uniref:Uncharacterized protein n=1 Tax=Dreissena polymorpha TaxID=45954 RepID=A0A9D4J791_DREPO|nr:hypothetical protein DPMN_151728 [Dreissena polymorpha]
MSFCYDAFGREDSPVVYYHLNFESSDDDFVEIFLERDKRKSESCHSTLAEPKRFLCEDSSSDVVQPMSLSARGSED